MADVSYSNEAVEKGPEGFSPESVPVDTTISRVELLDTILDTFLQKLVAARSFERFTSCYKPFQQLDPKVMQWVYDKFVTQLPKSIREEISEIKEEGNLEAVLNSLDNIVEEGKANGEPAWRPSGTPEKDLCSVMAPYFLQQRDALCHRVQKQKAKNQDLADAVLAGRRQLEGLQQQIQALQQTWQALHREQRELLSVLRASE